MAVLGVWANLREKYLKKNEPNVYRLLQEQNKLEEHLLSYDKTYESYAKRLMVEYADRRGVNEELRKRDFYVYLKMSYEICQIVLKKLTEEIMAGK